MRGAFLLISFGVLFVVVRSERIDRPWTWGRDQVGAVYSTIARNFMRDGVFDRLFVQKTWTGQPPPAARTGVFTTHPPGVPLLLAAGFELAGSDAPAVARIVMMFGALLTAILLFRLVRRYAGKRCAAAAVLVLLAMPAAVTYGAWVDPVGWWSVGLVAWVVERWVARRTADDWLAATAIAGLWSLAMIVEWTAVFLLPLLFADAIATGLRHRTRTLVALAASALAVAFVYQRVLPSSAWIGEKAFKFAKLHQWNAEFFSTVARNLGDLCSWPALAVAAVGLLGVARAAVRHRVTQLDRALIVLVAFQFAYSMAYPAGTHVHDFCLLYLLVPVAALAGIVLVRAHDALRRRSSAALASSVTAIALLAWGGASVYAGTRSTAADDETARIIAKVSNDIARTVRIDEVVATVFPREQVGPLGYHADRPIIGAITTAAALRALDGTPWRPAILFIPHHLVKSYGALVEALDRVKPHQRTELFRYYDLRAVDLATIGRSEKTIPSGLGPPRNVVTEHDASGVTIRWKPPREASLANGRYLIEFGDTPGVYPVSFQVDAPQFRQHTKTAEVVHFAIRAFDTAGHLGRPTPDHRLELTSRPRILSILAAVTIALLTAMTAVTLIAKRRRPTDETYRLR